MRLANANCGEGYSARPGSRSPRRSSSAYTQWR